VAYIGNIVRDPGDPKIISSGRSSMSGSDRLAKGLGWFSLALGLVEMLAPRRLARVLGMRGHEPLLQAYGAREIASGVVTLSPDKEVGLWSRVAGDGVDLLTLLTALRRDNPKRENVGMAIAMVLGVTMLDIVAAQAVATRHSRDDSQRRYSDRSGFPGGIAQARGIAKSGRSGAVSGF
jgi:hypothetical protein